MLTFTVKFTTDNAAFDGPDYSQEVARILRQAVDAIEQSSQVTGQCRDINGNRIGYWSLEATGE